MPEEDLEELIERRNSQLPSIDRLRKRSQSYDDILVRGNRSDEYELVKLGTLLSDHETMRDCETEVDPSEFTLDELKK